MIREFIDKHDKEAECIFKFLVYVWFAHIVILWAVALFSYLFDMNIKYEKNIIIRYCSFVICIPILCFWIYIAWILVYCFIKSFISFLKKGISKTFSNKDENQVILQVKESPVEYISAPKKLKEIKIHKQKNDKFIGDIYERFVGNFFEKTGYSVTYCGIEKGIEDGGIDLICRKIGSRTLLVQCKHWSKDKIIRENVVYQLHGSVDDYSLKFRENCQGVLCCSCSISNEAKESAKRLDIAVYECFFMNNKNN